MNPYEHDVDLEILREIRDYREKRNNGQEPLSKAAAIDPDEVLGAYRRLYGERL